MLERLYIDVQELKRSAARQVATVERLEADYDGLFVSLCLNRLLTSRLGAEEMQDDYTPSDDGTEVTYEL